MRDLIGRNLPIGFGLDLGPTRNFQGSLQHCTRRQAATYLRQRSPVSNSADTMCNHRTTRVPPMTRKILEQTDLRRRDVVGGAAATAAAVQLGIFNSAMAQTAKTLPSITPGATTSFAPLKQIDAGVLNVAYAEAGPSNGPPVILLHGWPYDIYSFVDVTPALASAGYRVIVPYLRGYGATRFLSNDTFRNAQQAAVALDIIALMDALKIEKPVIGAFDWGARTANIIAALWPERCKGLVSVSGYLIGNPEANRMPLPPQGEFEWWYRYYFATERGRVGYEQYRH